MLRQAKKLVNKGLKTLGLEVDRAGTAGRKDSMLIRDTLEAVALYRETVLVLAELPELDERQIDLLIGRCGTSLGEALYILSAVHQTRTISGDVCEFGVAQGATSVQIAYMIREGTKHLYLLDSFEGLSKPTEKDKLIDDIFDLGSMAAYAGTMATPMQLPASMISSIGFPPDRVHFIKQMIEGELRDLDKLPAAVSFAYFDMDLYEPTLLSLEWFHTVSRSGAIAIVDDYGFLSSGVESAVTEFLVGENYELSLPVKSAGHFCQLTKR
jgi:O-methyltransferase